MIFGSEGGKIVKFNASDSYIAECSTTCPAENCYDIENLKCYNLPKDKIGIDYELWFNWTFSDGSSRIGSWTDNYGEVVEFSKVFLTPEEHWAKLKIGYEEK